MTFLEQAAALKRQCSRQVPQTDPVALGAEMRRIRAASGLSLLAVGDEIGLSTAFLCKCEKGEREISAEDLALFLEVCAKRPEPATP